MYGWAVLPDLRFRRVFLRRSPPLGGYEEFSPLLDESAPLEFSEALPDGAG